MEFAQKIFVIVFATLLALVNTSSILGHDSEIGLLSFMARSNDILQQDPSRSLDCFNKYIPLINEIANDYETNFKACVNESEAATVKADAATLEQRNELANAAESSCALLKQCPENPTIEGVFQCYIDGGSANLQTIYLINANASQELAALREQYYLIQNSAYKCTNETKRVYEKNSAEAYAGLNNCILGNEDIVTKEPSSTAQPTTEPIVTTSIEPQTSDNPVTAPNSPESTEKVTEETSTQNPQSTTESPTEVTEASSSNSPRATSSEPEITQTVPVETTSTETTSERTEIPSSDSPRSTTSEPELTETIPVENKTESPEENISENPEEFEDYNY